MSDSAPFERFPHPRQLVGVSRDEHSLRTAVDALERSGMTPEQREVLHGAEDARSLDIPASEHGLRGLVTRVLQAVSSDDLDHVRRHAEHMRAGHYVFAVENGTANHGR